MADPSHDAIVPTSMPRRAAFRPLRSIEMLRLGTLTDAAPTLGCAILTTKADNAAGFQ